MLKNSQSQNDLRAIVNEKKDLNQNFAWIGQKKPHALLIHDKKEACATLWLVMVQVGEVAQSQSSNKIFVLSATSEQSKQEQKPRRNNV